MPYPARGCAERCHARRAARLRAQAAHRKHARWDLPLHSHPVPRACLLARPFVPHLTRPSPQWGLLEPCRPQNWVGGPSRRALQFCHPGLVWQAEEAVANLPLRLAVRVHCGLEACAQHDGGPRPGTPVARSRGHSRVLLGYPTGIPLPGYTRENTQRALLCRLERVCANDLMCRCRGWSCS
jgi:hypothetical protein